MSTNANALIDAIIADAENKVKTDLKNISAKVKNDFVAKAKEVVMLYYAHYTPRKYDRTYNLQGNVVDDSLSYAVLNSGGYGAWIQFNSANMSDYNMGSKDVVVANFMYGIHGRPSVFMESIPAIDLMDDFQNGYKSAKLDGYFKSLGYKVYK